MKSICLSIIKNQSLKFSPLGNGEKKICMLFADIADHDQIYKRFCNPRSKSSSEHQVQVLSKLIENVYDKTQITVVQNNCSSSY